MVLHVGNGLSTSPFLTHVLCTDCRLAMYGKTLHTPALEITGAERSLMPPAVPVKRRNAKRVVPSTEFTITHSKAHDVVHTAGESM